MHGIVLLMPALLIGLTLSAAGPEQADDKVPPRGEKILDRVYKHLDADGDGSVTRAEFGEKMPEVVRHVRKLRARAAASGQARRPGFGPRQGFGRQGPWQGQAPRKFRGMPGPFAAEQRAENFKNHLGLSIMLDRLIEDKVEQALRKAMMRKRMEDSRDRVDAPRGYRDRRPHDRRGRDKSRGKDDLGDSPGLRDAGRMGRGGDGPPPGAAMMLLRWADRNGDRRVDATEMDQVVRWLRNLDRNDDKVLDKEDLKPMSPKERPARPDRQDRDKRPRKARAKPAEKDG